MKKRVTLLLALMSASAMLAAGCGGGSGSTGAEETGGDTSEEETASFEEKQEGDTFTVGFDQNFPPMGFVGDDGEYTKRSVNGRDGSLYPSPLHGRPKMRR